MAAVLDVIQLLSDFASLLVSTYRADDIPHPPTPPRYDMMMLIAEIRCASFSIHINGDKHLIVYAHY